MLVITSVYSQSAIKDWFSDLKGKNSGHTTCNFLSLPVSSQQLALGSGSFMGCMDATDLPLFPATSALSNRNKFAITHLEWIMGLRKEYAGALFPIPDIGTIGVFSQIFTPGEFTQARDIDENVSHPGMLEFAGGFSLATSLLQRKIHLGMSVSYIESQIDDASGRAVSFSSNLLVTPHPRLTMQLNAAQLGTSVRYTHTREKLPAQAGLALKVSPLPDYLPFISTVNFDLGAGIRKIADEPLVAGFNSNIHILNNIHLLTSYDYTFGKPLSIEGFGVGAGTQIGVYGLDLSWKNPSRDLGSVWAATLKLQLNEKQPRTAENYYVAAVKYFNRKMYSLSTFYAKKALQLDPSMWEAHSLLLKIRSSYLRNKNLEIGLFYTGNIKGAFTAPFDPSKTGGIARIATLLKSTRKQFPVFFSIESGNFIHKTSDPLRIRCASEILTNTGIDALCCGSEEYAIGSAVIEKASGHRKYKLILSSTTDNKDYLRNKILESNGYRLYVASYIGSSMVKNYQNHSNPECDEKCMLTDEAYKCNLRILVIDETWNNVRSLAAKFQSFDIIICNNSSQQFSSPVKVGNVTILSPGKNGEYAGYCSIRFNDSRQVLSIENHIIPVNADIIPDPTVDSLVKQLSTRIEFSAKGIDSVNLGRTTPDGTFLFLSDRDSTPGIFLKDLKQHAEFPLTRSSDTVKCDLPTLTLKTELIAYRSQSKNDSCSNLQIMNLPGISRRTIVDQKSIGDATFSPDGKWLFYSVSACNPLSYDIYKIRYDGGKPVPVIDWKESSENSTTVSPDNSTIAFCSDRDGSSQIYICGTDGTKPVRITDSTADYTSPSYSPSGNYLAYLSTQGNYYLNRDLWVYDRLKGAHRQITSRSNIQNFCWLNDGVTIVYSSGINIFDLNKVNIEHYRFNRLFTPESLKTWSDINPGSLFYEGKERVIFTREYADTLRKVMMVNTDGSDLKKIINSKRSDWLP